jgi:hypothetical protein
MQYTVFDFGTLRQICLTCRRRLIAGLGILEQGDDKDVKFYSKILTINAHTTERPQGRLLHFRSNACAPPNFDHNYVMSIRPSSFKLQEGGRYNIRVILLPAETFVSVLIPKQSGQLTNGYVEL